MMQVALLNTLAKGGAFAACNRLRLGLINRGLEVSLVTGSAYEDGLGDCINYKKFCSSKSYFECKLEAVSDLLKFRVRKRSFLASRPKSLEIFSFPDSSYELSAFLKGKNVDLVNLHWVTGMIDYGEFFSRIESPVVWTLHDMNPFSGGDHFDEHYESVDADGNLKLRKISKSELELKKKIQDYKRESIAKFSVPLKIVSPSKWLASEAERSGVFGNNEIFTIPNGVDSNEFHPIDQSVAKRALGVDDGKVNLVYISENTRLMRKGGEVFAKALSKCKSKKKIRILVLGWNQGFVAHKDVEILSLGFVSNSALLKLVYSAGDATVIPSLADNFPNTMLESIMCARPVIGFYTGGISDVVQPGFNGLLANQKNAESLASTLDQFVESHSSFLGEEIRRFAVKHFDIKIQSENYVDVFNKVLS